MRACVLFVVIISGSCFLSPSLSEKFFVIKNAANWNDAQNHCREKYTDLASVTNMEDLKLLHQLGPSQIFWLGLYGDTKEEWKWKWSVEEQDSSMVDTGYRNWDVDEPNGGQNYNRFCTIMFPDGTWQDEPCDWVNPVLCYKGDPSNVTLVADKYYTWNYGRDLCRSTYTDLAIVKDQPTNDLISQILIYKRAWIGLYRESWKWSDGSNVTLTNWAHHQPSGDGTAICTASFNDEWMNMNCHTPLSYVCYGDYIEQKVVKVVVRVSEPSVDMIKLQDGLLEELRKRMANLNIDGMVTIRWRKQLDGNVFHKKIHNNAREEEEHGCR
ncbi:lymphocyte antigen 75-like [Gouania willdenowi]|uniref:lymphocyte antigen 75-like n=1 Tax=Gouania willdenowi TaxID=441366 RepID=UPI001055691C|nr:lymphocyte antigen 75-like [Gouania willdenowi]